MPTDPKPLMQAAYELGAKGSAPTESERLLFEEWMRGHCWKVGGTWDGKQYVHADEAGGYPHPQAMLTRQLWAAWRDARALSAAAPPPVAAGVPEGWKLVPVDATEAMCAAAVVYANGSAVYKNVAAGVLKIEEAIYGEAYAAMLAAAPSAPAAAPSEDGTLLDWLDEKNRRFKMGWKVGQAPAGNVSIASVIFLGSNGPTPIRDAIRAAIAADKGGA